MIDQETAYRAIFDATCHVLEKNLFGSTMMPCADFYETIKEAAEKAFSNVIIHTHHTTSKE